MFYSGGGHDVNLQFGGILNQNDGKRKIKALPCCNGKMITFNVGILEAMDSNSFIGTSINKITANYNLTNKSLYPYECFKSNQSYYIVLGNLTKENFQSSLTIKKPSQEEVDSFTKANSNKTGEELTLEYTHNEVKILQNGFSFYTRLNIKTYKLNPLDDIRFLGYSFDCF